MSADAGLRFTRVRDLVTVGFIAAVVGYLVVRLNYGSIPALPRLAGGAAALLGVAEAGFGWALRSRIKDAARPAEERRADLRPVPPLTAARALMTAKASSLAGAAVAGLWLGLLVYVVPSASDVSAAASDTVTSVIGLVGALMMVGGAIFLEHCCRAPSGPPSVPRR